MNIGDDDTQHTGVEDSENTSVSSSQGQSDTGTTETPEGDEGGEKTFTQKELDEIIGKRLAKERKQIARDQELRGREEELRSKPITGLKLEDFDSPEEYAEALADARLKQAEEARKTVSSESEAAKKHNDWVDAQGAKFSDFEQVALNPKLTITSTMGEAIMEADNGGDVLYHLGSNPDEATRISKLSVPQQVKEIAKLEAQLAESGGAEQRKTSSAPPPIAPASGRFAPGKKPFDPMDADQAKNMDPAEWIRADRERRAKKLKG